MISWINLVAIPAVTIVTGLALIYLVNFSMATNRWSKFPGAFGSFPTKSSPYMVKGHVIGIVSSSWDGTYFCLAKSWHYMVKGHVIGIAHRFKQFVGHLWLQSASKILAERPFPPKYLVPRDVYTLPNGYFIRFLSSLRWVYTIEGSMLCSCGVFHHSPWHRISPS